MPKTKTKKETIEKPKLVWSRKDGDEFVGNMEDRMILRNGKLELKKGTLDEF